MDDLRRWLDRISERKQLKIITGADWNLEIGGITQLNWKDRQNPALLFDEIQGYPPGHRVLTGSTSTPERMAITFGLAFRSERDLPKDFSQKLPEWLGRVSQYHPAVVKTGPVMQNVDSGAAVDLFKFPTPLWHVEDGGRYIGTGCCVITRSPDSEEINVGTYRIMLHDRNTLGLFMVPGRHGRIHC